MKKTYYERNKAKWRGYYQTRRHKAPLYAAWRSMMIRCGLIEGGKERDLRRYRDRGISVCERWRDYEEYERWAFDNGWTAGLQVDRIDNDGNYEPSNCRIVTARRNACNRSNTIFVNYNGKRMDLRSAYDASGCKLQYKIVNTRVRRGWSLMRALGGK